MKTDSELTLRALLLGSVIAAVFTAANVYLGLRVGLTVASSIPAAVISMGILRAFRTGSIRENNIVQTVTDMSKFSVLQQTGIAALQQSNQMQQAVLRLLQ